MLTGCGGITGESIRELAQGCTRLRELSLSGCGGVGNGDLKELAKGCTALRHLNIAQCSQVSLCLLCPGESIFGGTIHHPLNAFEDIIFSHVCILGGKYCQPNANSSPCFPVEPGLVNSLAALLVTVRWPVSAKACSPP